MESNDHQGRDLPVAPARSGDPELTNNPLRTLFPLGAVLAAGLMAGCGGGGAGVPSSGGTSQGLVVAGTVTVPAGQLGSRLASRAPEDEVPLDDATAELVDLETDTVVDTDTTDDNGNYEFDGLVPGRYEVRCHKSVDGKRLKLSNLVDLSWAKHGQKHKADCDLSGETTVAAKAVRKALREALEANLTMGDLGDLEELVKRILEQVKARLNEVPDLSDDDAVEDAGDQCRPPRPEVANFVGNYEGEDESGAMGMLVKGNRFLAIGFEVDDDEDEDEDNRTNNDMPYGQVRHSGVVYGKINAKGFIQGKSKGGLEVKGVVSDGWASGFWKDGERSGEWKVQLTDTDSAGLFFGGVRLDECTWEHVAVMVDNDGMVYVSGEFARANNRTGDDCEDDNPSEGGVFMTFEAFGELTGETNEFDEYGFEFAGVSGDGEPVTGYGWVDPQTRRMHGMVTGGGVEEEFEGDDDLDPDEAEDLLDPEIEED